MVTLLKQLPQAQIVPKFKNFCAHRIANNQTIILSPENVQKTFVLFQLQLGASEITLSVYPSVCLSAVFQLSLSCLSANFQQPFSLLFPSVEEPKHQWCILLTFSNHTQSYCQSTKYFVLLNKNVNVQMHTIVIATYNNKDNTSNMNIHNRKRKRNR